MPGVVLWGTAPAPPWGFQREQCPARDAMDASLMERWSCLCWGVCSIKQTCINAWSSLSFMSRIGHVVGSNHCTFACSNTVIIIAKKTTCSAVHCGALLWCWGADAQARGLRCTASSSRDLAGDPQLITHTLLDALLPSPMDTPPLMHLKQRTLHLDTPLA